MSAAAVPATCRPLTVAELPRYGVLRGWLWLKQAYDPIQRSAPGEELVWPLGDARSSTHVYAGAGGATGVAGSFLDVPGLAHTDPGKLLPGLYPVLTPLPRRLRTVSPGELGDDVVLQVGRELRDDALLDRALRRGLVRQHAPCVTVRAAGPEESRPPYWTTAGRVRAAGFALAQPRRHSTGAVVIVAPDLRPLTVRTLQRALGGAQR